MRTLIRNIGTVATGDIDAPIADADSILVSDGRIEALGRGLDAGAVDQVVDAMGSTAMPGLIDSHAHPVFGDFTPRQQTQSFIESGLHGGVTTVISAGGVRLVGEIGLGSVKTGAQAAPMVAWAKQHGMTVTFHTGGPSIAGSNPIAADALLEARPHIVGHVNGGTTPMSDADIERVVDTDMAIEIVHCGNGRAALHALRAARGLATLGRVIIGNDAPSGTGVVPLGILRTMAHLASLGGIAPELAIAMATGNTARVHKLDVGMLAPGRAADIVLCDAPVGSSAGTALEALAVGDLPGISMVLIDGAVQIGRSRNTPPASRAAEVVGGGGPASGGH